MRAVGSPPTIRSDRKIRRGPLTLICPAPAPCARNRRVADGSTTKPGRSSSVQSGSQRPSCLLWIGLVSLLESMKDPKSRSTLNRRAITNPDHRFLWSSSPAVINAGACRCWSLPPLARGALRQKKGFWRLRLTIVSGSCACQEPRQSNIVPCLCYVPLPCGLWTSRNFNWRLRAGSRMFEKPLLQGRCMPWCLAAARRPSRLFVGTQNGDWTASVSHWLMVGANCRMDLGCYPLHAVLPARPYLRLLLLSQIFYRGAWGVSAFASVRLTCLSAWLQRRCPDWRRTR